MECPYIEKNIVPSASNKPINYKDLGGPVDYTFYDHIAPDGRVTRVQFCQRVGRKTDVFECLNENEWMQCRVYDDPRLSFTEAWDDAHRLPYEEAYNEAWDNHGDAA